MITVTNHHQRHRLNLPLIRRLLRTLLCDLLHREWFELGIHVVPSPEMIRLNEAFLRHRGSTDVITFDYSEQVTAKSNANPRQREHELHGEIFICLDEAFEQARRFRTSWESEVIRYAIHGVLHLCGFDDRSPAKRRVMKQQENRLVRSLSRQYDLARLARRRAQTPPRRQTRKPTNG